MSSLPRAGWSLAVVALALLAISPPAAAQSAPPRAMNMAPRIAALATQAGAEVAVAYRLLDGTDELFVRADEPFHAASTMKVPVMIELFRQADAGAIALDSPMPVTNRFTSIVDGSPYSLDATDDSDKGEIYRMIGKTMSPRALCEAMITVSSNLATNVLIERLDVKKIQRTVAALGAGGMQILRGVEDGKAFRKGLNNTTTARGLQILLQAIATGQAASADSSREMVEILKRQQFNTAIPAGLPPGIAVAHKTGWITKIHHDAAIVYAPRPYVLVVLVRGVADERASAKLIADISRVVFDQTSRTEPAAATRP